MGRRLDPARWLAWPAMLLLCAWCPAVASAQGSDGLDLPLEQPVAGSKAATPAPTPPPDPEPEPIKEQPPEFFGEEVAAPTESIIFVIDRSGSMYWKAGPYIDLEGNVVPNGSRFERAKVALKRSIQGLSENFTFNMIFYDHCVLTWKPQRVRATDGNKQAAFAFIDGVRPQGWTNIGMAVYTALEDKDNRTVVLLSDGAPNYLDCGKVFYGSAGIHRAIIELGNTQGAQVHAFGIGLGVRARKFLMSVAAANGGSFTEVN